MYWRHAASPRAQKPCAHCREPKAEPKTPLTAISDAAWADAFRDAAWRSFAIDHPEVVAAALSPGALRTDMTRYDTERWAALPEPAENIAKLRAIIARLTPADSGHLFHFNGERLPW